MKASDLGSWIMNFNPFFIKEGNKIKHFNNYGEVYLYMLRLIRKHFPRGFVDVPLLMHIATGQPLAVCARFAKKSAFITTTSGGILTLEAIKGELPKEKYEKVMRAFHSLSQTNFSQDFFNDAWNTFLQDIGKEN